MKNSRISKLCDGSSQLGFCFLCIVAVNVILFATANYVRELGFSIWGITISVFCVCVLISAVLGWRDFVKLILKHAYFWALIAYGLWIVLTAVIGVKNGHNLSLVITDIKRVIVFALFPLVLWVLRSEKRILILMKCVVYANLVLSIIACAYVGTYVFSASAFERLLYLGYYGEFINFTRISPTICRVLLVSTPFQIVGCAFGIYFLTAEKKFNWLYVLTVAFGLFSIFVSYTRALYLATAVAAVIITFALAFAFPQRRKRLVTGLLCSAAICAVLIASFSVCAKTNYFGFAVQRVLTGLVSTEGSGSEADTDFPTAPPVVSTQPTVPPVVSAQPTVPPVVSAQPTEPPYTNENEGFGTGDNYLTATQESDDIRQKTKEELLHNIRQSPIFGLGLGYSLPNRSTPSEYFFLELAVKTGIVGVVLYLLPFALMLLFLIKDILNKRGQTTTVAWACGLVGLMVYAIFQPYMNTAQSVFIYVCTLAVSVNARETQSQH